MNDETIKTVEIIIEKDHNSNLNNDIKTEHIITMRKVIQTIRTTIIIRKSIMVKRIITKIETMKKH